MHLTHFLTHVVAKELGSFGYFMVFAGIFIEDTGIPFPGETSLTIAAVIAATTHKLNIFLVIACAAGAAILGDNMGFWIGRTWGLHVLKKYGKHIAVSEESIKMGLYLFKRWGSSVVFFARWLPILRLWGALLAGSYCMKWRDFLIYNAAGGILWSIYYGTIAYYWGKAIEHSPWAWWGGFVLAGVIIVVYFIVERRIRSRWLAKAQEAFPGPLE